MSAAPIDLLGWIDLAGVGVFAASGALVASRKRMDLVGFALVASVTGIGGGTLRDVLIDRPVFWLHAPRYVLLCAAVALAVFVVAPFVQRRYPLLPCGARSTRPPRRSGPEPTSRSPRSGRAPGRADTSRCRQPPRSRIPFVGGGAERRSGTASSVTCSAPW